MEDFVTANLKLKVDVTFEQRNRWLVGSLKHLL